MAKKGASKKRARDEQREMTEDLDLDLPVRRTGDTLEDDVVHNRRAKSRRETDDMTAVLPSDAHRLDGYGDDEQGNYQEEEELAVAAERVMRTKATEEDFDVAGVSLGAVKSAQKKKTSSANALDAAPTIESVERDFASLTSSERLAVLKKESPELLKMLDDLKKYLNEVKSLAQPLNELIHSRKLSESDRNLVSFLETKVQLMLSYCMHVTFYLLLKSEGKKVAGHPVVDNLVEIRVYLEKMWPLEEKLQYSLNRLLSGKSTSAVHLDDMRPVQNAHGGTYASARSQIDVAGKARRQQMRDIQDAEELEREEQAAMTRVRTKKASALNAVNTNATIAPLQYREDEDQYFSKLTGALDEDGDDEGEEGLSLMDALRKRQKAVDNVRRTQEEKRKAAAVVADDDDDDDEEDMYDDDMDMEDDGETPFSDDEAGEEDEEGGDSEGDYEALVEEENNRHREKSEREAEPREPLARDEVARRKAGRRIELHRGLTKTRPKDRKTPRLAQRRKYERGLRVHKAQSRQFKPEAEGGFAGVQSIKPGVVRSRKL